MARTADEAKAQAEAETKANKVKADKTKAADSAQIESLKKTFGPVGTESNIDLQDRDVIENIVKGVYRNVTDNEIDDELLKQETDRYVNQIEKGSLTTYEKSGKENVFETTKRFSAEQVAAELPETIDKERPGAKDAKTSFDFLAWMSNLGGQF
jgi:hypothetical protein